MSNRQLADLPCPSTRYFPGIRETPMRCYGRNGHTGPHWSAAGTRWEDPQPDPT